MQRKSTDKLQTRRQSPGLAKDWVAGLVGDNTGIEPVFINSGFIAVPFSLIEVTKAL